MTTGWAINLNGAVLTQGCTEDEFDCLEPTIVVDALEGTPDGLGLPGLRTEDVTFYQRDGVKHFSDWYTDRILTFRAIVGPADSSCAECSTVREQLFTLAQAWKRACCDTELVIYPPCEPGETPEDRIVTGPYGVVGRPRVFQYQWLNREEQIAEVLMRFDAVDQRMYVLDACGTPGAESCTEIQPGSQLFSTCLPLCFSGAGLCFSTPVVDSGSVDPVDVAVGGTERVYPEITLFGVLNGSNSNPIRVENITTGDWIGYAGTITDLPVTINTEEGTAFDSEGTSKTHLLRGSLFMGLDPGNYSLRLMQTGDPDPDTPGYALVCFRDTVLVG